MIEIIKHGTKKECTCNKCGCVFSYDENYDVKKETLKFFGALGENRGFIESINCPQCKNEIVLKQTR